MYYIADISVYSAKQAGKHQHYIVNADAKNGCTYSASRLNLISLQTLLDYIEGKGEILAKTPYEALVENAPCGVVLLEYRDHGIDVNHCNELFSHFIGYRE